MALLEVNTAPLEDRIAVAFQSIYAEDQNEIELIKTKLRLNIIDIETLIKPNIIVRSGKRYRHYIPRAQNSFVLYRRIVNKIADDNRSWITFGTNKEGSKLLLSTILEHILTLKNVSQALTIFQSAGYVMSVLSKPEVGRIETSSPLPPISFDPNNHATNSALNNLGLMSQIVGKNWAKESTDVRLMFGSLARLAKKLHELVWPNYVYQPKPPKNRFKRELRVRESIFRPASRPPGDVLPIPILKHLSRSDDDIHMLKQLEMIQ